jgi:YggT family protein
VGRPWWYDDYWEKDKKPKRRRPQLPRRKLWLWIALVIVSLVLAANSTGFNPVVVVWIARFIYYFCRILTFIILIRVILSWFSLDRTNIFIILLDDITEPILSPLRRIIPRLGMFDISPLVAILILYLIPRILDWLVL